MRTNTWLRALLAAAIVLAGGAVLALASPAGGDPLRDQRVIVKTDGAVQTLALDDLADGETRELETGEHRLSVTRVGDRLEVRLDGEEVLGGDDEASGLKTMLWVDDGGGSAKRSERILVLGGDDASDLTTYSIRTTNDDPSGEVSVDVEAIAESLEGFGGLAASGEAGTLIFTPSAGGAPMVVTTSRPRPGMVRFRCEESGSELLLPEADAKADSYVCPATGCLMTRVEEPEDVHVIKIVKTKRDEGERPD